MVLISKKGKFEQSNILLTYKKRDQQVGIKKNKGHVDTDRGDPPETNLFLEPLMSPPLS